MNYYKWKFFSNILGRELPPGKERMVHVDVFELSDEIDSILLLFGGSGVDEQEYQHRSKSLIPVFGDLLQTLPPAGLALLHVCSPYDVPLARFAEDSASATLWNQHVIQELLEPWKTLPFWVSGFSGGAALALNGIHESSRCQGGAVFGADAVPASFLCPEHWQRPLISYCGPHDLVCNHLRNIDIMKKLEHRGQAESVFLTRGGHHLVDYAVPEALGHLIAQIMEHGTETTT